jgi:hypothetical protein
MIFAGFSVKDMDMVKDLTLLLVRCDDEIISASLRCKGVRLIVWSLELIVLTMVYKLKFL